MNKLSHNSTGFYRKSLLCAAVIASFALPLQAATFGEPTVITKPEQVSKKNVIKLGHSWSHLSDELASGFAVKQVGEQLQSKRAIAAKVAAASVLHVNLHDFVGNEKQLNAYLDEAMKQDKLMVFENSQDKKDLVINALPSIPYGDVVLIQPRDHVDGDSITVFGGGSITSTRNGDTLQSGLGEKPLNNPKVAQTDNTFITVDRRIAQMQGDELAQALNTVTGKINSYLKPATSDKGQVVRNLSGGGIGYTCPPGTEDERLCYTATITNSPYTNTIGNASINLLHHYAVVLFRTEQSTVVVVKSSGSANPTMKVDTTDHRAFYLKSVNVKIEPTSTDNLNLVGRKPGNANSTDKLVSTSGIAFGVTGDVATSGPAMGASFDYNQQETTMVDISDWETITTSNGTNAHWMFQLQKYKTGNAWVDKNPVGKSKLFDVPRISKCGLIDYVTEAIWEGPSDSAGNFAFNITTEVINEEIYFTNNPWRWAWNVERKGWVHSRNTGGANYHLHWLKYLD